MGFTIRKFNQYSDEEFEKINSYIKHTGALISHMQIATVVDKYLVQDRSISLVYETPIHVYFDCNDSLPKL